MGKDSLAQIAPAGTAVGRPTATARRLVDASVSTNTRRAYAGALGRLDAWLAGLRLDDAALAAYLAELRAADLAAVLATCHRPRRRGRGVESDQVAAARGRLDAVIAGLLFMGGLRRSEVAALRWADVEDAGDADGILVTVRRSKTNQVGETNDVRYLKNGAARAVRTLRSATSPKPADRVVPLSAQMIGLRFTAAGIERRVTAHSGMEGARERGCTGSTSLVIADYRLRPDPSIERHPRHPLNSEDERCCP